MTVPLAILVFAAPSTPTFEFLKPNETVFQRALVVEGEAPAGATEVLVRTGKGKRVAWPARDGRWRAIAFLKRGRNEIGVSAPGGKERRVSVTRKDGDSPYKVRVAWAVAADEPPTYEIAGQRVSADARDKMDTMVQVLQAFTAEALRKEGWGRVTFTPELDRDDKIKLAEYRLAESGDALRKEDMGQVWGRLHGKVVESDPNETIKALVVTGFARYIPETKQATGHTALGGGRLALFGGPSMWAWPARPEDVPTAFRDATPVDVTKFFDDSARRGTRRDNVATAYGAILHELGHTWGLPHPAHPDDIMTRGFDRIDAGVGLWRGERSAIFHPGFAAWLANSPWFRPTRGPEKDGKWPAKMRPEIRIDAATDTAVVTAPYGLRVFGAKTTSHDMPAVTFKGKNPPQTASMDLKPLRAQMKEGFELAAADVYGNQVQLNVGR